MILLFTDAVCFLLGHTLKRPKDCKHVFSERLVKLRCCIITFTNC